MYLTRHSYLKKVEQYRCNFKCNCIVSTSEELIKLINKHQQDIINSEYNQTIQNIILSYLSIYEDISKYICGDEIDCGFKCEVCRMWF